MPVPVPAATPAPRRLLRDVVFDKMLAAIADGTLELGERLNDDELVSWLGVSRTPVREAIAKLADYGLVDIEANRYTRVIKPSIDEFADTTRTAFGIWALIAERGVPELSAAQAKEIGTLLKGSGRGADGKLKKGGITNFIEAIRLLLDASGSRSLTRVSQTVSDRAVLMFGLAADKVTFQVGSTLTDGLSKAIADRDGVAAAATFTATYPQMGDYVDRVRAAEVFVD